ncbi:MAG TPA: hypothetical protein DD856_01290 [Sulfobacillus sp.]|nr:hypothetical protein [Sulfobacillus sp.]
MSNPIIPANTISIRDISEKSGRCHDFMKHNPLALSLAPYLDETTSLPVILADFSENRHADLCLQDMAVTEM